VVDEKSGNNDRSSATDPSVRTSRYARGQQLSEQGERGDGEIRKRAALFLALLAVVAGLFVVLMVTLLHTSKSSHNAITNIDPPSTTAPSSPTAPGPAQTSASTDITLGNSPSGSSAPSSSAPSTTPASSPARTKVGKPSCPGSDTCTVQGDVAGAMSAINTYRAGNGKKPLPTSSSPVADKCALSSGNDCPSSFVWVRVDNLSGQSVVTGVNGFHSSDDLLDDQAKGFQVGWAYDPGAKSLYCALIRVD
jgi:cytoskeletal protein RodZ